MIAFNERLRQIKRKGIALRVAFGCAVRVFLKVYNVTSTIKVTTCDKITVAYTLEINR